jgi:hypothetical protein
MVLFLFYFEIKNMGIKNNRVVTDQNWFKCNELA